MLPKQQVKMPAASKFKYTIQDAVTLAESRGGKCLATDFTLASKKIPWKCNLGHEWEQAFSVVKGQGTWCPVCAPTLLPRRVSKLTIQDAQKLAEDRGGNCLSLELSNGTASMCRWKCAEEHVWTAVYYSIQRGSWCPNCASESTERLCRRIMEFLYGATFWKARPAWLKSPLSNQRLELDCYNEELQIALEYQGEQHYRVVEAFKMTEDDLKKQQIRDKSTEDQCEERGVRLIVIPYTVKVPELYRCIRGLAPDLPDGTPEDMAISEFERVGQGEEQLRRIQAFLDEKFEGCKLMSTGYISSRAPLKITCAAGHEVEIAWQELCKGSAACHACQMIERTKTAHADTLTRIDEYLRTHNFLPFDHSTYTGSHEKMAVTCSSCARVWNRTWANLQNDPCCCNPEGHPLTDRQVLLAEIQAFCNKHLWKNIDSSKMLKQTSQLVWTCSVCEKVAEADWCTAKKTEITCCGQKKLSIRDLVLQKISAFCTEFGWTLTPEKYINSGTAIDWECVGCHKTVKRTWSKMLDRKYKCCGPVVALPLVKSPVLEA